MARRTAKQWARLVAGWQDSGLTAGEFGAKVKVEPSTPSHHSARVVGFRAAFPPPFTTK
ncbi:hypothetical protein QHF89_20110 [Polyangium sorediatum]|uniref:Uncharacterized protein n=1 Tax=Polyangium sorediatum TaxID=889274 RepID=A0ABT6NU03_9BACT|nr:hypothetical protein [Polyangium sorediatum]